ncbi:MULTISPECIES: hypothetical protein [Salinibaculum]|uniref:hypothetical protein n=1 Tax=Salinibaculum TaxID=2732368 RepID=UPI0030CCD502
MGAHEPAHAGQVLANRRPTDADESGHHCGFCGTAIVAGDEEHVEHCIPTDDGRSEHRERYCSPSCFIREMQHLGGIGTGE